LNTTLLPVPDGVGLNIIVALAAVAANERRMLPKIPGKIFMKRPLVSPREGPSSLDMAPPQHGTSLQTGSDIQQFPVTRSFAITANFVGTVCNIGTEKNYNGGGDKMEQFQAVY